jgi:hypothetical protein
MADIFLSYAREDSALATDLARLLEETGWSVFWDRRIVAGSSWDEVIERELRACKCVVVLWSRASVKSRWVKTEANFGMKRGTLIPAVLDETEPPLAFQWVETAQLQSWTGTADHPELLVLIEGVGQCVTPGSRLAPRLSTPTTSGTPKVLAPSRGSPRWRRRQLSAIAGGAAVVAGLIVVAVFWPSLGDPDGSSTSVSSEPSRQEASSTSSRTIRRACAVPPGLVEPA